jgi:hypothetical protein
VSFCGRVFEHLFAVLLFDGADDKTKTGSKSSRSKGYNQAEAKIGCEALRTGDRTIL